MRHPLQQEHKGSTSANSSLSEMDSLPLISVHYHYITDLPGDSGYLKDLTFLWVLLVLI